MLKSVIPEGEALRRALQWLAGQGPCTSERVQNASLRFDLSPGDEEFLLRQLVRHRGEQADQMRS